MNGRTDFSHVKTAANVSPVFCSRDRASSEFHDDLRLLALARVKHYRALRPTRTGARATAVGFPRETEFLAAQPAPQEQRGRPRHDQE